ncbi:MAG: hypothetical protein KDD60_07630 [Bdellovibrionales bacterium]|nr:hypothetical protein [Bdellovibrionales bacterium]
MVQRITPYKVLPLVQRYDRTASRFGFSKFCDPSSLVQKIFGEPVAHPGLQVGNWYKDTSKPGYEAISPDAPQVPTPGIYGTISRLQNSLAKIPLIGGRLFGLHSKMNN